MIYTNDYLSSLEFVLDVPNISSIEGSSLLVTGSTGLIGSAIVDTLMWLKAQYGYDLDITIGGRNERKAFVRFERWNGSYRFLKYNASYPLTIEAECDFFIHCASNAHPAVYALHPIDTIMTNIMGTKNALEFIANQRHGKLLYVSSSEVYGQREGTRPFRESESFFVDPLDSRSAYPNSKRLAETLCAAYADERKVNYSIVRPGHVYGPTITDEDSRAHAQFARQAAKKETIVMKSAGAQLRSYCYALDCSTAILTVLLNGKSGEAYNISNPDSVVTIKQLAEAMANASGTSIVYDYPSASEAKGYNRMECSALDSSKLESLGWKGHFDINKGARQTVQCLAGI